jgi:O-acetyl-ADP-ribose deacetylase (regulator of RNase III)
MQVWAVEGTAHSILFYLDMPSIDAVLHFIQATPELHGYLQDAALWTNLSKLHFGSQRASELQVECGFTQDRGWQWASRERACVELEDFLQSLDDLKLFDETVTVLQDDIERIDNIDGKPLDGIAFPTGSYLMNPHTGAAGVVFRRAGHALDDFVSDQSFRDQLPVGSTLLPTGSAIATPAFNAGVSKLIHCVGPGVGAMDCYGLLAQTYASAMGCMASEDLECVALVSISTGNLRVPCEKAAQVALRTIQKLLVRGVWQGKLAVVCNDDRVHQAFLAEKKAVLKNFNAIPPLPPADSVDLWFA